MPQRKLIVYHYIISITRKKNRGKYSESGSLTCKSKSLRVNIKYFWIGLKVKM